MIITLVVLWLGLSVMFFGSIALAAGRPIPPIDNQALINDPTLRDYQMEPCLAPGYQFEPVRTEARKLQSIPG